MEKKKEKEERWMFWRDTQLFDGGTSQEVGCKRSMIHNLEETWRNIDLRSGSGPLKEYGTEGNTEMEICMQIFTVLPQSISICAL